MADGIEFDFLPVGNGKHSGDAIAVRWKEAESYKVLIYDGGTTEYGEKLVEHVKVYFGTNKVDYVVNSHPDNDHAGGLLYVLENLEVGQLWMHRPWTHSALICDYFHDRRITNKSLEERLKKKMTAAYRLEKIATEKKIPIIEPFAGEQIGIFKVLSPTRKRYIHELIPAFEKSPDLKLASESFVEAALDMVESTESKIADYWDREFLPDSVLTSAENESSAVLFCTVRGKGHLLTGDAGVDALRAAAEFATKIGIHLPTAVTFAQIPHHGGRHNVSTETLDLVFGKPLPEGTKPTRHAYASASKHAPRHPRKVVTNAFVRRGFLVAATKGRKLRYSKNMPERGWGKLTYMPFHYEYDE